MRLSDGLGQDTECPSRALATAVELAAAAAVLDGEGFAAGAMDRLTDAPTGLASLIEAIEGEIARLVMAKRKKDVEEEEEFDDEEEEEEEEEADDEEDDDEDDDFDDDDEDEFEEEFEDEELDDDDDEIFYDDDDDE